jgi:RNA polymerase sigma factor (sigma-70 family)
LGFGKKILSGFDSGGSHQAITAMDTDTQLLHRYVQNRDEIAFTALVRLRLGLVYSVALRRVGGDTQLAEDVTQKVFTDLARKASSLSQRATLTGWLYVSTHHASAEVVRGERRRKTREMESQIMQTLLDESTPEPDLHRLRLALDEVIVALRDDEREAIALRFFEQRSFAEIGATLRLSEEAARKRLDRALEKLRLALSRRGLTSTSLALTATLGELGAGTVPAALATQIAGGALAQAAVAGAGWTLASLFSPGVIVAGAALLVGGWAVVEQHSTNQKLETELAGYSDQAKAIMALRMENGRLAREAAAAEALPSHSAEVQPQAIVPAQPAIPEKASLPSTTVNVTTDGRLFFGTDYVTLDKFLLRLKSLHTTSPDGESTLVISSEAAFIQMAYVIDEARKAGIKHVKVSNSRPGPIDNTFNYAHGRWF